MDYQEAVTQLGKRDSRKLKNNTYLVKRNGGDIAVKLHATDVVTFHQDGTVTYDTGGWGTVTTKDRMKHFGLSWVNIWSNRGVLYAHGPSDGEEIKSFRRTFKVVDGKVIPDEEDMEAKAKDMKRKVTRYAQGFIKAMRAGKTRPPSEGDCWFCLFEDANTGKTWGETSQDKDHLLEHFKESYYVGSLLVRALKVMGASKSMEWTMAAAWDRLEGASPETKAHLVKNDWEWKRIEKALRRYLLRQLGLAA